MNLIKQLGTGFAEYFVTYAVQNLETVRSSQQSQRDQTTSAGNAPDDTLADVSRVIVDNIEHKNQRRMSLEMRPAPSLRDDLNSTYYREVARRVDR